MAFTDEEKELLEALYQVWRRFTSLPPQHGDDSAEFLHHIHALQAKIAMRPVRRDDKSSGVWF